MVLELVVKSAIEFAGPVFLDGTVGIKPIKFLVVEMVGGFSVVNGRSRLLGALEEVNLVAGRNRRPGVLSGKSFISTSSFSSRSTAVKGNRFV